MTETTATEQRPPAPLLTQRAPARRRLPSTRALLAGGWALLLVSWAIANPPFVSPDEPDHYIRAVVVSGGEFGSEHTAVLPAGLWAIWHDPGGITCNAGRSTVSAACVEDADTAHFRSVVTTRAGAYPPVSYLLPGFALRAADDPFTADRLARLAAGAACYAFLLLGLALLAAPAASKLSLLGAVAAITPTALFIMASLNSSGLEIAAGFAFFAALLRIARGSPVPRWVWASTAVAGLALGTVRATGALWVVLDLAVFVALLGPSEARALGRRSTRRVAAAVAVVLVSVVANRVWEQVQGTEVTQQAGLGHASSGAFVDWLRPAVVQIPRILDEEVGIFGWVDTLMPGFAYVLWQGMVAALLGVAFLVGSRRERWTLAAATVLSLGAAVFLSAVLETAGSGDVQGRHVLPFAVAIPLLAGETVLRNRHKLVLVDSASFFALFCALAAFVHAVGWHASAQRQSVGARGPLWFVPHAEWTPPGGWLVWAATALIGSLLVALAGVRHARMAH